MRVSLIRHGVSVANVDGKLAGHTDSPLHPDGERELEKIRSVAVHEAHRVFFVSDLGRAVRTAQILFPAAAAALRKEAGFREIFFGSDENADFRATDTIGYFQRFMRNDLTNGGENYEDFQARVSRTFDAALAAARSESLGDFGVVAHFGVLRAILIRLGIIEAKDFFRDNIPNGLGYRLELDPKDGSLRRWEEIRLPSAGGPSFHPETTIAESVFRSLASGWGASPAAAERAWTELAARYAEPHRRYHTLAHVEAMLGLLAAARLRSPKAAIAAALYHDAVYRIGNERNEEESAKLAERELRILGADEATLRACVGLILLTKDHRLPETPESTPGAAASADEDDAAVFLDADLAALASDAREYREYRRAIREEYSAIEEKDFAEGRRAFLRQLLVPTPIFRTSVCRIAFEEKARRNLRNELRELEDEPKRR